MKKMNPIGMIVSIMESGMQPMSGTGIQSAMSNAGFGPINVSMGGISATECDDDAGDDDKFTADDYLLAKELIAQVGSADRARELLDNLNNVYDMLDMDPNSDDDQIAIIAGNTPDEVDFPVNRSF